MPEDTIDRTAERIVDIQRLCLTRSPDQVIPILDQLLTECRPVVDQMRATVATMLVAITEIDDSGVSEVVVTTRTALAGLVAYYAMVLEQRATEIVLEHLKETR